jgi:glycogen operon protein
MISHGDELGRTQQGNNNAYCQDNEISWIDWNLNDRQREFLAFTQEVVALRERHPNLGRLRFFQGRRIRGSDLEDLAWFRSDGEPMTDQEWDEGWVRAIGMRLGGKALAETDAEGNRLVDDDLFILLNGHHEPVPFTLPTDARSGQWEVCIDTTQPRVPADARTIEAGEEFELAARSLMLLRRG